MKIKVLFSVIGFALTVFVASHALAQGTEELETQDGGDVLTLAKEPRRSQWESSVQTTWLPASTVHGSGGEVAMGEVKAGFARRFSINPRLELSTGLRYSLREVDAPQSARLPGSLQTLSVHLGAEYRASDSLTWGLSVSPGLSSDFKSLGANDVRVPTALTARYRMSGALTLLGGIAYTGQNYSIPVLPVVGVLWMPADKWTLALGFPRTGVIYKPAPTTEFFLSAELSGGEYHLNDPTLGANFIRYRDYRLATGAEIRLSSHAKLGISGGYAFARKFVFYDGNRDEVNLDSSPFGKLECKLSW